MMNESITGIVLRKSATRKPKVCGKTGTVRQIAQPLAWAVAGLLVAVLSVGCRGPALPSAFPAGQGDLLVRLGGLRNEQGVVVVSLFAGARGFPDNVPASLATVAVPIRSGQAEVRFSAIPYGEYALSVLHDEDGDGRMATGLFGAPREGFGFSGHPDYRFGHPDFAAASFLLLSPQREIEIGMRYETGRRQHQEEGRGGELRRPQE